jgi:hypothetical protein
MRGDIFTVPRSHVREASKRRFLLSDVVAVWLDLRQKIPPKFTKHIQNACAHVHLQDCLIVKHEVN